MQRAKQLMEQDKEMPLSEVAYKCGFSDAAYFSKTFKQHEGITPSVFRKSMVEL
ncbi:MAG: AraC family transcriptional regulator [Prevotella sp.]|nr:AraC family transcriptional regulator [Prevotella sp.]